MNIPNIGNIVQTKTALTEQPVAVRPIVSKPTAVVADRDISQAAELLNRAVQPFSNDLLFSVDQSSGKTVVRVVDTRTREIIRQIPTEEALAIAKAIDRLQGLIVRQKA